MYHLAGLSIKGHLTCVQPSPELPTSRRVCSGSRPPAPSRKLCAICKCGQCRFDLPFEMNCRREGGHGGLRPRPGGAQGTQPGLCGWCSPALCVIVPDSTCLTSRPAGCDPSGALGGTEEPGAPERGGPGSEQHLVKSEDGWRARLPTGVPRPPCSLTASHVLLLGSALDSPP